MRSLLPFDVVDIRMDVPAPLNVLLQQCTNHERFDAASLHAALVTMQMLGVELPETIDETVICEGHIVAEHGFRQSSTARGRPHLDQPEIVSTYHMLRVARLCGIDVAEHLGEEWVARTIQWLLERGPHAEFVPTEYPTIHERHPWVSPCYARYLLASLIELGHVLTAEEIETTQSFLETWFQQEYWSLTGISDALRVLSQLGISITDELATEIVSFLEVRLADEGFTEADLALARTGRSRGANHPVNSSVATLAACSIITLLRVDSDFNFADYSQAEMLRLCSGQGARVQTESFVLKTRPTMLEWACCIALMA